MELKKREEVIKSLECHASGKLVECEQCPLDKAHLFNATCVQTMCNNALALINELTEENEGLKEIAEGYQKMFEDCYDEKERLIVERDLHRSSVSNTIQQMQTMIKEKCIAGGIYPAFVARVVENVEREMLEGNDNV